MARVRGSFSRIDWSTMPNGDWVMRRRSRYESVTTASTNQWSVAGVKRQRPRAGQRQGGLAEGQAVLAAGHLGPGEDDDVEDLGEDEGRDREVDVAQPGGEVGHEHATTPAPTSP